MMLVETCVGPSTIEGLGVFAVTKIKKGTQIWTFSDVFDRLIPEESAAALPPEVQRFLERYSYRSPEFPGFLVLEMDNGRFMNHSDAPNTDIVGGLTGFATRTIGAGEELTCDYRDLEHNFHLLPSVQAIRPARAKKVPAVAALVGAGASGR